MSTAKSEIKRVGDAQKAPKSSRKPKVKADVNFKSSEFVRDSSSEAEGKGGSKSVQVNIGRARGAPQTKRSKKEVVVNGAPAKARKIVLKALDASAKTRRLERGDVKEITTDSEDSEEEVGTNGKVVKSTMRSATRTRTEPSAASSSSEDDSEDEAERSPLVNGSNTALIEPSNISTKGQESPEEDTDSDSDDDDLSANSAPARANGLPARNDNPESQSSFGEESEEEPAGENQAITGASSMKRRALSHDEGEGEEGSKLILPNGTGKEKLESESDGSDSEVEDIQSLATRSSVGSQNQEHVQPISNHKPTENTDDESEVDESGPERSSNDKSDVQQAVPRNSGANAVQAPEIAPFQPPDGFHAAEISQESSSQAAQLLKSEILEGKEIFHITAPKSLPVSSIKELSLRSLSDGSTVLTHESGEHGFSPNDIKSHSKGALLVPSSSNNAFHPVKSGLIKSLQLRQLISLPDLSVLTSPASRGATQAGNEATASKKEQPAGLKMRSHAYGLPGAAFEESDSDDEMEDIRPQTSLPQFVRPDAIQRTFPSKKRKHAEVDTISQPKTVAKKSKKSKQRSESSIIPASSSPPPPAKTPNSIPFPSNMHGHLQVPTPGTSIDTPTLQRSESKEDRIRQKEEKQRRKLGQPFQVPSRPPPPNPTAQSQRMEHDSPNPNAVPPTPDPSQSTAITQPTPTPKPTSFIKASDLPIISLSQPTEPIAHALQDEAATRNSQISDEQRARKEAKRVRKEEKRSAKEAAKNSTLASDVVDGIAQEKKASQKELVTEIPVDAAYKMATEVKPAQINNVVALPPGESQKKKQKADTKANVSRDKTDANLRTLLDSVQPSALQIKSQDKKALTTTPTDAATLKQQRKEEKRKRKVSGSAALPDPSIASASTPNLQTSILKTAAQPGQSTTASFEKPVPTSDATKVAAAPENTAAIAKQKRKEEKQREKNSIAAKSPMPTLPDPSVPKPAAKNANTALTPVTPAPVPSPAEGQNSIQGSGDLAAAKQRRKDEKRKKKAEAAAAKAVENPSTIPTIEKNTPTRSLSAGTPLPFETTTVNAAATDTPQTNSTKIPASAISKQKRKREHKNKNEAKPPVPSPITPAAIESSNPPPAKTSTVITPLTTNNIPASNATPQRSQDSDVEMPDVTTPISTSKIDPLLKSLNVTPFVGSKKEGETKEERAKRKAEKRARKEEKRRKREEGKEASAG